jgi:hypothetical protein
MQDLQVRREDTSYTSKTRSFVDILALQLLVASVPTVLPDSAGLQCLEPRTTQLFFGVFNGFQILVLPGSSRSLVFAASHSQLSWRFQRLSYSIF